MSTRSLNGTALVAGASRCVSEKSSSEPLCALRKVTGYLLGMFFAAPLYAQTSNNPFETPIPTDEDVITVGFTEFAELPDYVDGEPAYAMHLESEPGGDRVFVSDVRGIIYAVANEGRVTIYLDLEDDAWDFDMLWRPIDLGFDGFALHPQFNTMGAPGHGRFYTWADSSNTAPQPDFRPNGGDDHHDTVLLEWRAVDPSAGTYDGGPPRELMRFEQPFRNHNGGQLAFNPFAPAGSADFGLLYVGSADGGSGGDPLEMGQDLSSGFGKIFRIDPLGTNSRNGQYGIPDDNPFANDDDDSTLGEIYAYGLRNPQRFAWDSTNGRMFVADVGQGISEEVSPVTIGANLGWSRWEGSYRFISHGEVNVENPRGESGFIYPIVEYGHDPLLLRPIAASGLVIYRWQTIPQLENLLIFADNPSGEIFYVPTDPLPDGGHRAIRRILLNDAGSRKTMLQVIQERNEQQGREPAERADLRIPYTPDGRVFLLNKRDGVIRLLAP